MLLFYSIPFSLLNILALRYQQQRASKGDGNPRHIYCMCKESKYSCSIVSPLTPDPPPSSPLLSLKHLNRAKKKYSKQFIKTLLKKSWHYKPLHIPKYAAF